MKVQGEKMFSELPERTFSVGEVKPKIKWKILSA